MDGEEVSCSQVPNSIPCDFCNGKLHPLVAKVVDEPWSAPAHPTTASRDGLHTPPATQAQQNNSVSQSAPKFIPNTLFNGLAPATASARKKHAESAMDLMERF